MLNSCVQTINILVIIEIYSLSRGYKAYRPYVTILFAGIYYLKGITRATWMHHEN